MKIYLIEQKDGSFSLYDSAGVFGEARNFAAAAAKVIVHKKLNHEVFVKFSGKESRELECSLQDLMTAARG